MRRRPAELSERGLCGRSRVPGTAEGGARGLEKGVGVIWSSEKGSMVDA